jgi:hypothetical protein
MTPCSGETAVSGVGCVIVPLALAERHPATATSETLPIKRNGIELKLSLMIGLHAVAALLLATLFVTSSAAVENRRFVFEYETLVGPIAEGDGPVHIFVPLAASSDQQRILDEEIVA